MSNKKDYLNMYQIKTDNENVIQIMKLLSQGKFEEAGEIAKLALDYFLSDEEAIMCYLAIGFASLHDRDFQDARAKFGSASGLAQKDMRLKLESLIAEVYAKIDLEKEAKRRFAPVNGVITMKLRRKGNSGLVSIAEDLARVQKRIRGSKARLTKKQKQQMAVQEPSGFFKIPLPF
ncbi:MAG: hypothetical protein ACM3KR_09400 [Deltaproteobacteria bacterium]